MIARRRDGFTFVELLMAMTVVGILAAVALPKFRDVRRRATAARILGDFDVMRHATMSFYVDSGYFPKEAGSGAVPRNMRPYLPNGFSMARPQWTIDYENWELKKSPRFAKTGITVGVSFITTDRQLGQAAMKLIGNVPAYTIGSKYTFLISAF